MSSPAPKPKPKAPPLTFDLWRALVGEEAADEENTRREPQPRERRGRK